VVPVRDEAGGCVRQNVSGGSWRARDAGTADMAASAVLCYISLCGGTGRAAVAARRGRGQSTAASGHKAGMPISCRQLNQASVESAVSCRQLNQASVESGVSCRRGSARGGASAPCGPSRSALRRRRLVRTLDIELELY
jgi:hypothetical protein